MENDKIFYAGDVFNRSGVSYCCSVDDLSTATACADTAVSALGKNTITIQDDVSTLYSTIDSLEARVAALEAPQHKSRSNLRSALRTLNYRREV